MRGGYRVLHTTLLHLQSILLGCSAFPRLLRELYLFSLLIISLVKIFGRETTNQVLNLIRQKKYEIKLSVACYINLLEEWNNWRNKRGLQAHTSSKLMTGGYKFLYIDLLCTQASLFGCFSFPWLLCELHLFSLLSGVEIFSRHRKKPILNLIGITQ